jgi:hypothetical protein
MVSLITEYIKLCNLWFHLSLNILNSVIYGFTYHYSNLTNEQTKLWRKMTIDRQQFHLYQQNEQLPLTSNHGT